MYNAFTSCFRFKTGRQSPPAHKTAHRKPFALRKAHVAERFYQKAHIEVEVVVFGKYKADAGNVHVGRISTAHDADFKTACVDMDIDSNMQEAVEWYEGTLEIAGLGLEAQRAQRRGRDLMVEELAKRRGAGRTKRRGHKKAAAAAAQPEHPQVFYYPSGHSEIVAQMEAERRAKEEKERQRDEEWRQRRAAAAHAKSLERKCQAMAEMNRELQLAKEQKVREAAERREAAEKEAADAEAERKAREEFEAKREAMRLEEERAHAAMAAQQAALDRDQRAEEFKQMFAQLDIPAQLARYDAMWAARDEFDLLAVQLPWPVLGGVSAETDLTEDRIREFILHPLRLASGRSKKAIIRAELMRWHSDKFRPFVFRHVTESHREGAALVGDLVAKVLTTLLNEE